MHRTIPVALVLLLAGASQAAADVTLFTGRASTPESRTVRGLAADAVILILGIEFEYSDTPEDIDAGMPGLRTAMFNGVAQTPSVLGLSFYATAGGGLYQERLSGTDYRKRGAGTNTGGGVKIPIAGAVGLRVDYRIFLLRGSDHHDTVKRFYMGATLRF